ncbi:MAG: hypothetical protein IT170_18065 [Bryobacterales bacterium]|nr:hypothetical protein [Bryobacterales bacterium]
MSKPVLVGLILLAVVAGLIIWSSTGLQEHRVEVCVTYEGRTVCRTASGATQQSALRQAQDNACALLTSGVTGSITCGQKAPDRVTWMQ